MKIEIKHRWTEAVLFTADVPDDMASGMHTRHALEKATAARANLARANLAGANLAGANLARANLDGAYLDGANLARANLDGANLDGRKLVGERPVFQIGPIGSRCSYVVFFLTETGMMVRAGCFSGTRAEFEEALEEEHGDNEHAQEYRAALVLADVHAKLWTPAAETAAPADATEAA